MKNDSKGRLNTNKLEILEGKMKFVKTKIGIFKRKVRNESGLDIELGNLIIESW